MDTKRTTELDFLKTVATIFIVCHHYQQVFNVKFEHFNFFGGRFYFGYLVELFFIISGLCAHKWINNIGSISFLEFYYARVRRLLPLLSISIIVDAGTIWVFKFVYNICVCTSEINLKNIIISCLGMQSGWIFKNPGINNPMWYVSVLLLCYIIMYFLTWLAKTLNIRPYILYVVVIFVGMLIVTLNLNYPFLNNDTSRGYLTFFLGLCLGRLFERKNVKDTQIQLVAVIALIIGVFAYIKSVYVGYAIDFLIWPSVIILLKSKWLEKSMKCDFWTKVAQSSFDVYVWHTPFMHLIYGLILSGYHLFKINNVVGLIIVVITVEILGIVSYKFIEKPILRILNKV